MKHLSKLSFLIIFIFGMNSILAQDENNPWAATLGVNAIDFFPTGVGLTTPNGNDVISSENFGKDLFFVTDNWNYVEAISSLGLTRYIGDGFNFELSSSYNRINRFGESRVQNLSWVNVDGTFQFNFKHIINGVDWFDPYIGIGAGYFWLDDETSGTFNSNLGINFWITETLAITVDTNYKTAFQRNSLDFFQHRLGVKFAFGGKDTDGDGIYDKNDDCPQEPGLEEFNGCPDSDNDGIADKDDDCPNTAGLPEFNGCPDTDGDGLKDSDDECPNEAGLKALNGCPDADEDGIADKDDDCPNEAGPKANGGCPWPDTDGDGVLDKDDQCPNEPGTVANNGCPEVTEEVQNELNDYAKTINFDTGKSSISKDSEEALEAILAILSEYPNAEFTVEGHTDSVGSSNSNKKLSDQRALSVKNFLVNNGVDASRLTSIGYGEDKPIANNNTRNGRAQNRRVEINLVK